MSTERRNTTMKHPQIEITDTMFREYEAAGRGAKRRMAERLGISYNSLRGAVSRYRTRLADAEAIAVPGNFRATNEAPVTLPLPAIWVYATDFHCPFHNQAMVRRLALVLQASRAEQLVIGGDLFDFPTASSWPKTSDAPSVEAVSESAADVLLFLGECVPSIVLIPGNHDLRFGKKIDDKYRFSKVVYGALEGRQLACKLQIVEQDSVYLGDEGHDWRAAGWVVGHPRWFSSQPTKFVAEVAMMKHRNVMGAHSHLQGNGWSKDARYHAVDPGHMTDPALHPYHAQSDGLSRYPTWKAGFVLVRHNIPTVCSDGKIRWVDVGAI